MNEKCRHSSCFNIRGSSARSHELIFQESASLWATRAPAGSALGDEKAKNQKVSIRNYFIPVYHPLCYGPLAFISY